MLQMEKLLLLVLKVVHVLALCYVDHCANPGFMQGRFVDFFIYITLPLT